MYGVYQILYGDTLESVAKKTNSTIEEIKKINDVSLNFDLIPGTYIVVPKKMNSMFEKYIVQKGDSIYSIASKYNINPFDLIMLNGIDKDDYIYPNQEVLVPSKDIQVYITKSGDTIFDIISNFGVDIDTILSSNEKLLLVPEQLVVYKKS